MSGRAAVGFNFKMRFSTLASAFLASLLLVTASPILEKDDVVTVTEVVYDSPKIKPKMFIISMVRHLHFVKAKI